MAMLSSHVSLGGDVLGSGDDDRDCIARSRNVEGQVNFLDSSMLAIAGGEHRRARGVVSRRARCSAQAQLHASWTFPRRAQDATGSRGREKLGRAIGVSSLVDSVHTQQPVSNCAETPLTGSRW